MSIKIELCRAHLPTRTTLFPLFGWAKKRRDEDGRKTMKKVLWAFYPGRSRWGSISLKGFYAYWKQIQLHNKTSKNQNNLHHVVQLHARELIAIELIGNKLDENKESIELTILFDYSYSISHFEIPTWAFIANVSKWLMWGMGKGLRFTFASFFFRGENFSLCYKRFEPISILIFHCWIAVCVCSSSYGFSSAFNCFICF